MGWIPLCSPTTLRPPSGSPRGRVSSCGRRDRLVGDSGRGLGARTRGTARGGTMPTGGGGIIGIRGASGARWVEEHVEGGRGPLAFELIAGGHSNLTYRVTDMFGHAYVLRRPPTGAVLATA